MPEFLTTHGTAARVEKIIADASQRIVLITPYLRWSRILLERLVEADRRGIEIVLIYGKERLQAAQQESLEQLENLSLYYCANLHAKCYFNEERLVITSLNLHEFSEKNNREMGVAFSRTEAVYKEAIREAQSIIEASRLERGHPVTLVSGTPRSTAGRNRVTRARSNDGSCIRCGRAIPFDPDAPYCRDCFASWVQYENYDYLERKCHKCGHEASTSRGRPLCATCFASQ